MRNMRKKFKLQKVEVTVYDSNKKAEQVLKGEKPDFMQTLPLPKGVVEIDRKIVSERDVVITMSPETFFKHGTVIEIDPNDTETAK